MNTEVICAPGLDVYEPRLAMSREDYFFESPSLGGRSDSGVTVNGATALGNCNVWKAINTLAGDVGQLPIKLFQKQDRSRTEIVGQPEIDVLQVRPNAWQTSSVWKETMMWWALLWGNGCSWIRRNNRGEVWQLVPLRPDRVTYTSDNELSGSYYYTYTTKTGAQVNFDQEEVFHIRGLAGDGIWGISLLDIAKNCIGHGLSLEKHANSLFANGAIPGVILKHPNKLSREAAANLRESWNSMHAGPKNAGRTAVLEEAMDAMVLTMTNRDAELALLRKMDQVSVANLFGLPLFKLNSMEDSSVRANLEEQNRDYFNTSLSRWLNRFVEEAARKIIGETKRAAGYYYKWVPEAFLKGDIQKRYAAYSQAITSRILSPNEAREKEDLEPYDGGDEYANPAIEAAGSTADTPAEDSRNAAAMAIVRDRVKALIMRDANDIKKAAKSATNFVQWADARYSDGGGFDSAVAEVMQPTLDALNKLATVREFNQSDWQARWKVESKRLLFKLCDQTTKETFYAAILEELDTWKVERI